MNILLIGINVSTTLQTCSGCDYEYENLYEEMHLCQCGNEMSAKWCVEFGSCSSCMDGDEYGYA